MENLNAEQIIKALECCIVNDWNSTKCNECPIYNGGGGCIDELKEATLTLINSQERKIKELENRLKECENGYEGTLYLDRCKLHDAEQKIKELTEKNEEYNTLIFQQSLFINKLIKGVEEVKTNTVQRLKAELYKEFLKVARCQMANEPNMRSQEVFNILELITKKALGEV